MPSRAPRPGQRIGPYEVLSELGRGGMGAVYLAREVASGREVALKVMLDPCMSSVARERFAREGRIAASLDHAGILRVHAAGVGVGHGGQSMADDGVAWLACEVVTGARRLTLALADRPLRERLAAVRDAARALGHAHRRGVVHRDVKPDNLLVDTTGRVRVTDFGLAAAQDLERLTQSGVPMGTPAYMAPEQVEGARGQLGPPTDVWALGVVIYELVSGERPFAGLDPGSLFLQIVRSRPTPLSVRVQGVSPALEAVAARALAPSPGDRYPDGDALADDLDRLIAGDAVLAPPPPGLSARRAVAVLTAVAIGAAVGVPALIGLVEAARPAPVASLRLSLEEPREGAIRTTAELVVRGRVAGGAGAVEVRLEELVTGADGAVRRRPGPSARLATAGEFSLSWSLPPGDHVLEVQAEDGAGHRAPVVRRTTRGEPAAAEPAWFTRLAPTARPGLPLPPGLSFGPRAGEYVNASDGSVLVWVPPGTFTQGAASSASTDAGFLLGDTHLTRGGALERRVTLTRGVFVGKYEVTWRQFDAFCAATSREPPRRRLQGKVVPGLSPGDDDFLEDPLSPAFTPGADHPVYSLVPADVEAYCAWAGVRTPTEAEWERAARGDDGRRFPWGDRSPGPDLLNTQGAEDGYAITAPVGSFPLGASPYGCMDMAGNVTEILLEWLAPYPEGPVVDPTGPATGERRVTRGQSWLQSLADSHAATFRTAASNEHKSIRTGFRVARSP